MEAGRRAPYCSVRPEEGPGAELERSRLSRGLIRYDSPLWGCPPRRSAARRSQLPAPSRSWSLPGPPNRPFDPPPKLAYPIPAQFWFPSPGGGGRAAPGHRAARPCRSHATCESGRFYATCESAATSSPGQGPYSNIKGVVRVRVESRLGGESRRPLWCLHGITFSSPLQRFLPRLVRLK